MINKLAKRSLSVLALFSFFALVYIVWSLINIGYLPAPLSQNHLGDNFMDFFNTNSFALREDVYISWSSIYMPLNFFIAKFFIFEGCFHHANNGLALRGCAIEQYAPLVALHFISLALFAKKIKTDLNGNFWESIMIFFVLIFSLPALFLLERGNYLIVFNFFLGLLVNTNSEKIKILLISLMINIKQYFLLPVFLL